MKLIFTAFFLCMGFALQAQIDTSSQCWKQQVIPSFSVFTSDSTAFANINLEPKKKTVFMLFSPDCDHCQKQVELMQKNAGVFKNAQLVLITTASFEMIREFEKKYAISKYPFITICRDPKMFFGVFFKLKQVPMLAFYGSDSRIKKIYNNGATMKQIKAALAL